MTHRLLDARGYLQVAAAPEATAGTVTVQLQLDVQPMVASLAAVKAAGNIEALVERSVVATGGSETETVALELNLQQAFHLLAELEDVEAQLARADR